MNSEQHEIRILRHGDSALSSGKRWITPAEFREWIVIYDRTGIAAVSEPPADMVESIRDIPIVVCSDLPRSIESAARLVPGRPPRASALFREVGRPVQGDWPIRLPLHVWDRISCWLWSMDLIASNEPIHAARSRAQEATRELVRLAEEFGQVLFVGHGTLNSLIGRELRRHGWVGPRRVRDVHWSGASYRRRPRDP